MREVAEMRTKQQQEEERERREADAAPKASRELELKAKYMEAEERLRREADALAESTREGVDHGTPEADARGRRGARREADRRDAKRDAATLAEAGGSSPSPSPPASAQLASPSPPPSALSASSPAPPSPHPPPPRPDLDHSVSVAASASAPTAAAATTERPIAPATDEDKAAAQAREIAELRAKLAALEAAPGEGGTRLPTGGVQAAARVAVQAAGRAAEQAEGSSEAKRRPSSSSGGSRGASSGLDPTVISEESRSEEDGLPQNLLSSVREPAEAAQAAMRTASLSVAVTPAARGKGTPAAGEVLAGEIDAQAQAEIPAS